MKRNALAITIQVVVHATISEKHVTDAYLTAITMKMKESVERRTF
jgi:RNA binding exosome subunit